MKAKVKAVVGAILLLAIIAVLMLASFANRSLPKQRLPDGSWLRVVSTSYGQAHSYDTHHPNQWQSFLLQHLPSSWSAHLGLWHYGGGVGCVARAGQTNLAVFTFCEQAAPTSFQSSVQMDVFDERTHKVGIAFPGATAGSDDRRLVCWALNSKVPRDMRRLVLRFSELAADGKTRQQVAEFIIPNPAREEHHD